MAAKTKTIVRYRRAKKIARKATKMTLPLAVVAGFACPIVHAYDRYKVAGLTGQQGALTDLVESMTGYDPYARQFNASYLKSGLMPVIIGVGVHKLAGFLGINRSLAQAGIPFIRI